MIYSLRPRAGQEPALLLPLIQLLIETDHSKPPDPDGAKKKAIFTKNLHNNLHSKKTNEILQKIRPAGDRQQSSGFAPLKSAPRSSESAIQTKYTQTRPCKKGTAQAPQPLLRSSFGSRCATSTVQPHLDMLTFRILSPLRNEPGEKSAPRRGESAPRHPRVTTSGGAPAARRTRF